MQIAPEIPVVAKSESLSPVWLFSPRLDLGVFLGSGLLSLILLAIGWQFDLLDGETPDWAWISLVLMIDVAHVWSTAFRVYFDKAELRRRLWLYSLVPVFGYAIGVALYSEGDLVFWRVLAAIAVFHFIRQQWGWVALYRRKIGDHLAGWKILDIAAIYLATIYPLAYWLSSLPRNFEWFVQNDFIAIPAAIERILFPLYLAVMVLYASTAIYRYCRADFSALGKDFVVLTTAVCWYLGIVAFNSDYAFTVTNVIIHGVPYFALIYFYARGRRESAGRLYQAATSNWFVFLATVWALAYFEELFWHRGVWVERQAIFGEAWNWQTARTFLVPLLAVPQLTHYVLDGFIWRRRGNPDLRVF